MQDQKREVTDNELFRKLRNGDRIALSRAITLIESRQADHIVEANALLDVCTAVETSAMRIAISGAPGTGKSSFIETLGKHIVADGRKLAVLAIDPSSQLSGGAILGDKTRMPTLANHPNVFIRPTAAGTHLGGVAERTREAILLCETAGFDIVIVETVGVGQSEMQVRTMVDQLALLITPGGGDEVQGIKRGILEAADLVLVNKADGDMQKSALETKAQYAQALRLLHAQGKVPPIVTCSAINDIGVSAVWDLLQQEFMALQSDDKLGTQRREQDLAWFEYRVQQDLLRSILRHPDIISHFDTYKHQIQEQTISVRSALSGMSVETEQLLNRMAPSNDA